MSHSADSRDSSGSADEVDTITLRIINGMVPATRQFLPDRFCSRTLRSDRLKMNPEPYIYPTRLLSTLLKPTSEIIITLNNGSEIDGPMGPWMPMRPKSCRDLGPRFDPNIISGVTGVTLYVFLFQRRGTSCMR